MSGFDGWRDPERIPKVLELFGELWKQRPDARFGQLISNLIDFNTSDELKYILFNMEESEWIHEILKRLKQTK